MWLIGMMGSGKTTVGEGAAAKLGVVFYDTDRLVEEMADASIPEVWDDAGEEGFRELERKAIASLGESGFIAAAGGGAVLDEDNRDHMRGGGPVVWLRCDPGILAARLTKGNGRPLLEGDGPLQERLAGILSRRMDLYSAVATDVIDTDTRDVEDVVSEVVAIWRR